MSRLILCVCVLAFSGIANAQKCQDLRDLGDDLTVAIPVAALGITALKRDKEGAYQWFKTAAFAGAGVGLFKEIGDKTRPDAGTSRQSFVSGHSAGGFIGASYLYTRYGKAYGIPAYGLALLTAYSRVCAQKHFADDVLGGALVAMMANWYASSPIEGSGRLYPSFTSNGVELSFSGLFDGNRQPRDIPNFRPRYRVVFEFGPVVQDKNIIRSPNDGIVIDLESLEAEYHMTARMIIDRYLNDRHELRFWYGPMGMTDFANPVQPFTIGDTTFDPSGGNGAIFDSNYRWWDVRGTWRYNLVKNEKWTLRAGLGIQFSRTEFEVEQRDAIGGPVNAASHAEESVFAPMLHLSAAYQFNEKWSVEAEIDAGSGGDVGHYWNDALWFRYKASPIWDLSFGGRIIDAKLDTDDLYNEIELSDLTFQIGRSF